VRVRNIGTGELTGMATTEPPFSVIGGASYSIVAGGSHLASIQFAPTTAGAQQADLVFEGNDSHALLLYGIGVSGLGGIEAS